MDSLYTELRSKKAQGAGSSGSTPVPVDAKLVIVPETTLLPEMQQSGENVRVLPDMTGVKGDGILSSSRFGLTRLLRGKVFGEEGVWVGKFYNTGNNREGLQVFIDRIVKIASLSHPSVMGIVGLIAPTKTSGPIVITRYSEFGSLSDVLDRVQKNDLPPFWNDAGKLRMIVSLISGLQYLHSQGIVHRELKPTDLIVCFDGSIKICSYLMSILEEFKYTKASQVAAP
jgi:serine/threonine protein kinase